MAVAKKLYTPEEYLRIERAAEFKSEYLSGEIFAMAGTSERHALICSNINVSVAVQTNPQGCTTYGSDLRVHVKSTYAYPDISVVCGKTELVEDRYLDNLLNPTVLFEVLSPTTEGYDRGEKFARYARINSLVSYVLVLQTKPRIELFQRMPDNSWRMTAYDGLDSEVEIPGIDCVLKLAEVYRRVEFGDEPPRLRLADD